MKITDMLDCALATILQLTQKMFKIKNEKWKKEIRDLQREEIKRMHRDRVFLIEKLNDNLALYKQCSLISGQEEHLDHHNFFDCESFVIDMNQQFFRLIIPIGIQYCKTQLLQCAIPSTLYALTQTIENKTIEMNEDLKIQHFYSREKVLESITDILCLFTQDQELVNQYGEYIISMLATALKFQTPNATLGEKWRNKITGLSNLFEYEKYKTSTYNELRSSNFELVFQRYCMQIVDNRLISADINLGLFILFKKYLEHQDAYTEDEKSRKLVTVFSQLVTHVFSEDHSKYFDAFMSQFIDQFLKMCHYFHLNADIELLILKNQYAYPYLSFVQLFNYWTYNSIDISIDDFTCSEISEMLLAQTQLDPYTLKKYTESFAGCLLNLLLNADASEKATQMIWRCLQGTKSVQIYCNQNRTEQSFVQLNQLLNIYPLFDL